MREKGRFISAHLCKALVYKVQYKIETEAKTPVVPLVIPWEHFCSAPEVVS